MSVELESISAAPQAEARFFIDNILESSTEYSIIGNDLDGKILLWNEGAQRLYGYAPEEVVGKANSSILHTPEDIAAGKPQQMLEAAMRNGHWEGTIARVRRGGQKFMARVVFTPRRDGKGKAIGFLLISKDISAEIRLTEERKATQVYARSLIEASLDPLVTISSAGIITDVNEASVQATGVAREDLIGTDFSDYFTEPEKAREGYEQVFSQGFVRDYPLAIRHISGRITDVLYNASICKDDKGAVLGVFAASRGVTERKQAEARQRPSSAYVRSHAEEALLKAGALQSAIFNSANFSSIATDEKGVIQIFNAGAERMLGYAAAEVMNKITQADISDPREVIARAEALSFESGMLITPGFEALVFKASRGIEDIYELTYIRKDGSRFPAVVSVTALRDDQEAIIGYLLIGTDNTARKKAEEALVKAGALQKAIFNSANFSSIATDEKGVIQIFNVGAERMLGYAAAEVMNKITPADISDPREVIARAEALSLESGTSITPGFEALVFKASREIEDIYELTYIRKDGSRFPAVVSVTALRDDQEAIIGYLLIGTDNTARKQVEAEQKKLDQRLRDQQKQASQYARSLIEASLDPLVTISTEGKITDVNEASAQATGVPREELIGTDFSDYFTEPDTARAGYQKVFSEGFVRDYSLAIRHASGSITDVLYNASVYKDDKGRVLGVFAAARDVTERQRFERSLQEASRMKSEFLANMSHELRTPLNGIIGFAEFLVDGKPGSLNPKQSEYLGDILNSGRHLLQLINDVLDLAKVEAGKMEVNAEDFSLANAIEEVRAVAKPMAQKKNIRIYVGVDPVLDRVTLDQQKFKQVLYNLLSNGIKFTDDGGTVDITAGLTDADHFRLSVKDTGIGIREEDLTRLFREFEQLETGASRRYEGTGLGLALTRKLVELQGGTIAVESKVGEGSAFSVTLPLRVSGAE